MKKFREKMSERAGFTLVELIVVIAILGILAGAAVAGYSGYIKKANEAADTQVLSAVKTAADAAMATKGTVTQIDVTASSGTISKITAHVGATDTTGTVLYDTAESSTATTDYAKDFSTYYSDNTALKLTSDKYKGGAEWKTPGTDNSGNATGGWNKPSSE